MMKHTHHDAKVHLRIKYPHIHHKKILKVNQEQKSFYLKSERKKKKEENVMKSVRITVSIIFYDYIHSLMMLMEYPNGKQRCTRQKSISIFTKRRILKDDSPTFNRHQ
jgi:hypothetical protein